MSLSLFISDRDGKMSCFLQHSWPPGFPINIFSLPTSPPPVLQAWLSECAGSIDTRLSHSRQCLGHPRRPLALAWPGDTSNTVPSPPSPLLRGSGPFVPSLPHCPQHLPVSPLLGLVLTLLPSQSAHRSVYLFIIPFTLVGLTWPLTQWLMAY